VRRIGEALLSQPVSLFHFLLEDEKALLTFSLCYAEERIFLPDRKESTMATHTNTPGFAHDIRPLFREDDKEAMDFAFDLWDYQDVRTHADDILERLEDGTMPCDGEWPQEQIELFRRWIATGMPT
jgi:hypothetical protein